ncbi:MAG TPA: NAD(P)H-quinone oxidoreductase [Magnetospirillaceae bacterium]|jgi:NADPH2:quinone reductase
MTLPESYNCIELDGFGPPEVMALMARPMLKPGGGEVLIKVEAAGVNRPDVLQRLGNYPPPPGASPILGLEIAGKIVARGGGVSDLSVGDYVCALVTGGGYATYALAAAPLCLPIPKNFNSVQAAALPETFYTVWHNLFQRGRLVAGESVLIHGGGSGIGTTAIQLAKVLGARVFATARGAERVKACADLGADRAIDYASEDFVEVIRDETKGKGVEVVLDMVGGDYLRRNLACLAVEGRHVSIATLRGATTDLDIRTLMQRRLTLTGSTLRPRSVTEKAVIAQGLRDRAWPLLDSGRVKPVIHATFPLAKAADAHRLMESGDHFGKIVLTI